MDATNKTERYRHFEAYFNYLKSSKSLEKLPLKKLLYRVYEQACIDCGATGGEMSIEDTEKFIEDTLFLDFISDCILHPSEKPLPNNDYVKVVYDCTEEDRKKCVAWPDRCSDVGCDEEGKCSTIINISKLCGIESNEKEKIDEKILSEEEIQLLAKALVENEEANES